MGTVYVHSDLDMLSGSRITNLPDAVADQEPATLAQLKARIEGLAWKDGARLASTANINISSPGASIDSVTAATNDRVVLKDQSSAPENGIYIYNGAATPMTRALDASTFDELEAAVITVEEGTTNAGTTWRQTAVNGTIGSNDVTWSSFGTSVPDASETVKGKIEIATQGETDTGTDDVRALTPLKAKSASWMLRKAAANIGDGSNTTYTVTHNFNTRDVEVEVCRTSGNYDEIIVEKRRNNVNSVDIVFNSAPTSNQFRVTVVG